MNKSIDEYAEDMKESLKEYYNKIGWELKNSDYRVSKMDKWDYNWKSSGWIDDSYIFNMEYVYEFFDRDKSESICMFNDDDKRIQFGICVSLPSSHFGDSKDTLEKQKLYENTRETLNNYLKQHIVRIASGAGRGYFNPNKNNHQEYFIIFTIDKKIDDFKASEIAHELIGIATQVKQLEEKYFKEYSGRFNNALRNYFNDISNVLGG